MDDKQLSVYLQAIDDLPEGKTVLHEHPEWRDMAAVVGMIVLKHRNAEEDYGTPVAVIQRELKEEWGVEVSRETVNNFVKNTVVKALAVTMVPNEWHRQLALEAKGKLDTTSRSVELAQLAEDYARELYEKRGEVLYEDIETGKMRVAATHKDVTEAMKEARMSNREAGEALAAIGLAPKREKGGINLAQQFNFQPVDSSKSFRGFGKGRVVDAEPADEENTQV